MSFVQRLTGLILLTLVMVPSFAQGISGARQVCDSGTAAGFECSNVDLIAWLDRSQLTTEPLTTDPFGNVIQPTFQMNDMWGWEHEESGRSFLLAGRTNGTAFVEVTDPFNPVFLGELPSSEVDSQGNPRHSVWRDMKVYDNHAYIVADGAPGHGMQVFDLTQLLSVTDPQVFSLTNHYTLLSSVHNIVINEDTGYAFAVGMGGGVQPCGSGLHIIDLSDPANPEFTGCYSEFNTSRGGGAYTHDAHCVVYEGPDADWADSEICVNSNERSVVITDVTQKQAPTPISIGQYPATEYTHQGWLSDDHRYYFQGDELDEVRGAVGNTRTVIWDLQDLDDPVVAGEFFAQRNTIDHNMYVLDEKIYQCNYNAGLQVLTFDGVANGELDVQIDLATRDEVFGHADRFDEKFDMVRTYRKGSWKYIRNYQAYYADGLQNNYRYRQLAYDNWRDLYRVDRLNPVQRQFFERRPVEQLFNLATDPHEVKNLAADPAQAKRLADMRRLLRDKMKSINDLSFYHENRMVTAALEDGVAFGRKNAKQVSRLSDLADLALQPFGEVQAALGQALKSKGALHRYWALKVCANFGDEAKPLAKAAEPLLKDKNLMVRVRAAEFLGSIKAVDPMPTLYGVVNTAETEQALMIAFNTIVYLRDQIGHEYDPSKVKLKFNKGEVYRRVQYLAGTEPNTNY